MPEIIRNVVVPLLAGQLITASRADHLRNVRVRMQTFQLILALCQRIKELLVIKAPRKREVLFFSGDGVQVEQSLLHTAELDHLHLGPLLVADRFQITVDPPCHFFGGGQRLLVSAERVHVQVPGKNLVIGVKRRPNTLPFLQALVETGRIRTEIAALIQFFLRDQHVSFLLDGVVARRCLQQRARREHVSSRKMPAQFAARMLPSTQRVRGRRNARRQPEGVQQSVVRQRFDKALIAFQLVEKDSPAQAHLRQRKRLEFRVHRIAHRSACRVSKHAPERRETAARNDRGRPGCGCRGGNPLAAIPTMLPAHHGLPETLSQHPGASALCQCTSQSR